MIVTKKEVNKHIICQGCSVPLLLLIYPMLLSAEFLLIKKKSQRGARMTEGD